MASSRLSAVQATILRNNVRLQFEAWRAERLQVRANFVARLIDTRPPELTLARIGFWQTAIQDIDEKIKLRGEWMEEFLELVNRLTGESND